MTWYECIADASVRAVALAAMAGVLVLFLRRSPAAEHAVWTAVVAGMLALPVLRPIIPAAYVYVVERPAPVATIAQPAAQLADAARGRDYAGNASCRLPPLRRRAFPDRTFGHPTVQVARVVGCCPVLRCRDLVPYGCMDGLRPYPRGVAGLRLDFTETRGRFPVDDLDMVCRGVRFLLCRLAHWLLGEVWFAF